MKNTFESPQNEEHIFQMVERHTQQQRRAEMCKELYSITEGQSGYMATEQYYALGEEQAKNCLEWEADYFAEAWYEDEEGNIKDAYKVEKISEFHYVAKDTVKEYGLDWHIQAYRIPEGETVGECAWCEKEIQTQQVGEIDGESMICKECLH